MNHTCGAIVEGDVQRQLVQEDVFNVETQYGITRVKILKMTVVHPILGCRVLNVFKLVVDLGFAMATIAPENPMPTATLSFSICS